MLPLNKDQCLYYLHFLFGIIFDIRQYLKFAVSIWCPFLKGDINMIESSATKHKAEPVIRNLNYENGLRKLELKV